MLFLPKIGIYNPRFSPLIGGGNLYFSNIIQSMNDYMFEVVTNALPGYPLYEKFSNNAVINRFLPYDRNLIPFKPDIISKITFPYRTYCNLIREKKKLEYLSKNNELDMLHVSGIGFGSNLLWVDVKIKALFFTKIFRFYDISLPQVITMHNLFSPFSSNPVYANFQHFVIDQFENIICVDKNIEKYVTNYANSKNQDKNIWFIPNSVDVTKFPFSKIEPKKKLHIGFAGRFEYSRGIDFLQKLMKHLSDFCELHITSDPIQGYKNSNIHFHGVLPETEVPLFLRNIDILFNPVLAEGISRITLEAMSCGRPVIMLDKGDRYPTINGKTGYLIKEDINELLSLLEYINENRNELETLGKNARKIVEEEFSNEVIIPKIKKIYEDLMK